jgi:hypothetical protein
VIRKGEGSGEREGYCTQIHTNPPNSRLYMHSTPGKTHAPATRQSRSSCSQRSTKCTLRCSPLLTMWRTCPQRMMCSCQPILSYPSSTCPDGILDTVKNTRISAIRTHFQDGSQYLTAYDTNIKTVVRCKPMLDQLSMYLMHGQS